MYLYKLMLKYTYVHSDDEVVNMSVIDRSPFDPE